MSFGSYKRGLSRTFVGIEEEGARRGSYEEQPIHTPSQIERYWGAAVFPNILEGNIYEPIPYYTIEMKVETRAEAVDWFNRVNRVIGEGTKAGGPGGAPAAVYAAIWDSWNGEMINEWRDSSYTLAAPERVPQHLEGGEYDPSGTGRWSGEPEDIEVDEEAMESSPELVTEAEPPIEDKGSSGLAMGLAAALVGGGLVLAGKRKGKRGKIRV